MQLLLYYKQRQAESIVFQQAGDYGLCRSSSVSSIARRSSKAGLNSLAQKVREKSGTENPVRKILARTAWREKLGAGRLTQKNRRGRSAAEKVWRRQPGVKFPGSALPGNRMFIIFRSLCWPRQGSCRAPESSFPESDWNQSSRSYHTCRPGRGNTARVPPAPCPLGWHPGRP